MEVVPHRLFRAVLFCLSFYAAAFSDAEEWFSAQSVVQYAPNRFAIMGAELKITNKDWFYYSGGDAPEGAYMGWMFANVTSNTANVTLPVALPAGRYNVFVKGINYDSHSSLQVSMGGGQTIAVAADDRDGDKYWTVLTNLTSTAPASSLSLKISKAGVASGTEKFLFMGIYITGDLNEAVTREDLVIKLNYPTVMDDSPPLKGNLIPNGGFEVGVGADWGFQGYRKASFYSIWDPTVGYEGKASIRINTDPGQLTNPASTEALISRVYRLKPNKKYTVSLWAKCTAGKTQPLTMRLVNTFTPPDGYPQIPDNVKSLIANGTWQRLQLTTYAFAYPNSDYHIVINYSNIPQTDLWIDAVQLEEGDLTAYAPSAPIEGGLMVNGDGNIYYDDEPVTAQLVLRNHSSQTVSKLFRYEVHDYLNRLVKSGAESINLGPTASETRAIDISNGKHGIFRLNSWVEGVPNTRREVVYSVIYRPATTGLDESSFMGIHPNYTDFQLNTLQRMGIKWARVLSPSTFFRWSLIESAPGVYEWHDQEIQMATARGITTLGTLGTNNYWPAWAEAGGVPNLDMWEKFVRDMVRHYKPWVRYWEVWNEPYQIFTPEFYAQMTKRAVAAIEAEDPTAKIVGMGGDPLKYVNSVIAEMDRQFLPDWNWRDHLKILSTHNYPNGQPPEPFKPDIIDKYGVEVWNTETGTWDKGFYAGEASNFYSWGVNLWPQQDGDRYYRGMYSGPETLVTNFLSCVGSGEKKYFYYDSRLIISPRYFLQHPTFTEYDGSVRSKGIAYSIAGKFVDHSITQGNVSNDPNSSIYLFERAGIPTLALWTKDRSAKNLRVTLPAGSLKIFDVMGNQIASGSTVDYSAMPVYAVGNGITTAQLKQAMAGAVVSTRLDTNAPSISINEYPDGPVTAKSFRVRWIAIDDISLPGRGNPQPEQVTLSNALNPLAILYSYRLANSTYSWSTWSADTYKEFAGVPNGKYRFEVQAKDEAGNLSATAGVDIVVNGSNIIVFSDPKHPGDSNFDWIMTGDEATRYGMCWKAGSTAPIGCPTGILIDYAVRAGALWIGSQSGQYRYDATRPCPNCWVPAP